MKDYRRRKTTAVSCQHSHPQKDRGTLSTLAPPLNKQSESNITSTDTPVTSPEQTWDVGQFDATAMMAVAKPVVAKPREVDPYEDPHVWAVVDDGCDSACHSIFWHENAKQKWQKL